MKEKHEYYVISRHVLPEVFLKVVEVKRMLEKDKTLTVQDATDRVGMSRSSFYKYKDAIFPFYEKSNGKAITILIHLQDETGKLSDVLNFIAEAGANVLTINQMIPMNGIAIINICMETSSMRIGTDMLIDQLQELNGVQEIKILARE